MKAPSNLARGRGQAAIARAVKTASTKAEADPKRECFAALAYYQETVWKYVEGLPLSGAQYAVAMCAWNRLQRAHHAWDNQVEAREANEEREMGQRIVNDASGSAVGPGCSRPSNCACDCPSGSGQLRPAAAARWR